ncbi:hypothetical protein BDB01DRAFT_704789, partial [Pilobolus umbonatus]
SDWLPTTDHWSFVVSPKLKSVPVAFARPSEIRRLWHPDLPLVLSPPFPPMAIKSSWLISSGSWSVFWKLPLTHKAVTPWWRLLHDRIRVKARLHRWSPSFCSSPLCPICLQALEDGYHFVVGCPVKSKYWHDVIAHTGLSDLAASDIDIWCLLSTFSRIRNVSARPDQLALLGAAFSTLWRFYWLCFFENVPWSTSAAISM